MVMVKNYIYIATKIENKFLNFELVQEMRWGGEEGHLLLSPLDYVWEQK
jgi:hypothetical protein